MTSPNSVSIPGARVQTSPTFPNGIVRLDDPFLQSLEKKFQENLLDSFQKFEESRADLGRITKLFQDGYFNLLLRFHEAEIPIKKSPDLTIHEGAAVCVSGTMKDGLLSFPHPVYMAGFTALGSFFNFCKIVTNRDGHAFLLDCPCPTLATQDITTEILQSPAGPLFPNGKIEAVKINDLTQLNFSGGSPATSGMGEIFLKALSEIHLVANPGHEWVDDPPGTPGGSCHPLWISLKLFLDIPQLQKTIQKELYKNFDFSGILEGSKLEWPGFHLTDLPLPPGLQIPEGRADLTWRYLPTSKTTEIGLANLHAKILFPELFGKDPLSFKGNITLSLKANGEIRLHFEKFRIDLPSFPAGDLKSLSFSGTVNGDLLIQRDPSGLAVKETHLKIDDLSLKTLAGKGIQFPAFPYALTFDLKGNLQIDYVPGNPKEPLHLITRLEGGIWGEAPDEIFDAQKLSLDLSGGFRKVKERWVPNLADFEASLATDLTRKKKEKEATLKGKEFWLSLSGGGSYEDADGLHQEAVLEASFDSLQAGKFTLSPSLYLNLLSHQKGDEIRFEGDGEGTIQADSPKIDIGSDIKFSTDLNRLDWNLLVTQDQLFGDWKAYGEAEIKGGGEIAKGLDFILNNFKIKTTKPFKIEHEKKVMANGITVNGHGNEKGNWFYLRVPSLQGNRVDLSIHRPGGSDRLFGEYQVVPRSVTITPDFKVQDIILKGRYQTPSIPELFESPRIWLSNDAKAQVVGPISGPIKASLHGSLRYDPVKKHFYLWINPKKPSEIAVGPLNVAGENISLTGKAQLQGTLVAVLGKYGMGIGGGGVGVKNGELFLSLKDDDSSNPKKVPILFNSSIVADQLWQIHRGVAYAGGDGIKIDLNVNLDALQGKIDVDDISEKRHILYIVDQLPLSLPGYWRLFKKMQQDQAKKDSPSSSKGDDQDQTKAGTTPSLKGGNP